MNDTHAQFLERLHESMTTRDEVVDELVHEATGAEITDRKRLIEGEVNEVWSASTGNGDVVVRISHGEDPGFAREKWALDAIRQKGVPVPEVLLIKQFEDAGKTKTVCIESKLEGTPLQDIEIPPGQELDYARQIVDALERIHSVHLTGFSRLETDGTTEPRSFSQRMTDQFDQKPSYRFMAEHGGISPTLVDRAFETLDKHRPLYETVTQATLTHGDWSGQHMFFKDGQLTGIIDMENAKGNHISYDLMWWDFYWREKIPTKMLKDSLSEKPDNLELLINLQGLRLALSMVQYYTQTKNPHGLAHVGKNFDYYLAKFDQPPAPAKNT